MMWNALVFAGLAGISLAPAEVSPDVELGPYLQFTSPDTAMVRWWTREPAPSVLDVMLPDGKRRVEDPVPKKRHVLSFSGLGLDEVHPYRVILPGAAENPAFDCETMFNYTLPGVPEGLSPFPEDELSPVYAAAADELLRATGITHGYCLVLGSKEGRLAYELAKRSQLYVVGFDTDPDAVARARDALQKARAYGPRVTLRHIETLDALPLSQYFANLIVSDRMLAEGGCIGDAREILRVLHPYSGRAYLGQRKAKGDRRALETWAKASEADCNIVENDLGIWAVLRQHPPDGVGEWTHQYARPDNSGRSGDTLLGATRTDQFEALWVGRPGPRAMVDRNPRKPSPLYAQGRLFTQGLHRIIAQDAYNGALYWSLEIPHLERFNMPRDCSNWCADNDSIYVAVRDTCWRLDAATGTLKQAYTVAAPGGAAGYDWGYVANVDDTLYGSAVKEGTIYTNFWGKNSEGWYDAPVGPVTYKVGSDAFFAMAKDSGEVRWSYTGGVVLNATITLAEGRVFFAEARNDAVRESPKRRVSPKNLWDKLYLVALDAATGEKCWETQPDTDKGVVVYYLLHANNTLVIALSHKDYRVYAFDASNGAAKWQANHAWTGTDHSGHMQHPVVAGNTVYLEPCGYDLDTGERVTDKMGRHEGCATYAGAENALIYRGAGRLISLWDIHTQEHSGWTRLRPDCWLSTIAGGGMVLSPEGGGGCSCGGWMETSLAFMRKEIPYPGPRRDDTP